MSFQRTPITPELDDYILKNFSAEDEYLANMRERAMALKIPDISISPDEARIIQFLLYSIRAKYVLEIGTLAGYSAVIMARCLPPDGKLVTVESNNLHYKFACNVMKEQGLENIVDVNYGYGLPFLQNFKPDYQLDFVFLDADKKNLRNYVEICTPLMRSGGIIAIDNAFILGNLTVENPVFDEIHKHRIYDVLAVREFDKYFRDNPDYFTSMITVGDGLLLGIKK